MNLSGHGFETLKVHCPMDSCHISVIACEEVYCIANKGVASDKDTDGNITNWQVRCGYDDVLREINAKTAKEAKERIKAAQE